ncbi:MAG: RsmE family RNA methyltransferase [Spirochaetia bacterium]
MKQFVLPSHYAGEDELTLTGDDFHYLRRVRRVTEGESFAGRGRDGTPYRLTVVSVTESSLRLRVSQSSDAPGGGDGGSDGGRDGGGSAGRELDITLYQCLPKGRKLDEIVRQATEAGAERIVPVASARAVKRLDDRDRATRRLERWRRIAEEAVQQSGRESIASVEPVCELSQIPSIDSVRDTAADSAGGETRGFVCSEKALAKQSFGGYLNAGLRRVALVIGPEGGLSDEEISSLVRRGFNVVSLGPNVLRTETAAVYAIAAVQSVYREQLLWMQEQT